MVPYKDCFGTVKVLNAAARRGARHLSDIGASGEAADEMKKDLSDLSFYPEL